MVSHPNGKKNGEKPNCTRSGAGEAAPDGASAAAAQDATLVELRRLERLLAEREWPDRKAFAAARKRARERGLEALDAASGGPGAEASRAALLIAVVDFFGAMRLELAAHPERTAELVSRLEGAFGLPRLTLAREVLRAPELLTVVPATAVAVQLSMLVAFAPLRSASLWTLDDSEQVTCVRNAGEAGPSRAARQMAQLLLAGETPQQGERRLLIALSVGRWREPLAALVGSAKPGMREAAQAYLTEAVPVLDAILERDALIAGNAASERALVESSERKLTRLGFDLHDGPIQEVAVLAEDLRLFRSQLEIFLGTPGQRELVRGRMEDLDAQLVALEAQLRQLSNEVHAPVLLNRPFTRALQDVIQAFAARTDIEPRLMTDGDMKQLSVSQQIALLNIIHEALTNIREHSDATKVEIRVSVNANGVEAQVSDNGRGFDLERTLIRAAREGRLGLVAINERVRLLGGRCRIDSRPGGPTVVTVALERWEPLVQQEASASRASA